MGHLVLNIFASSLIRRDNKKNFVQACALAKVCVCVGGGLMYIHDALYQTGLEMIMYP